MKQSSDPASERAKGGDISAREPALASSWQQEESARRLVHFARSRGRLVLIPAALGLAVGMALNICMPKRYTAKASLEVSQDKSGEFRVETSAGTAAGEVDGAKIDTQIEILRSRTLALEVIRALHLERNADFAALPHGAAWDLSRVDARSALVGAFLKNLTVLRSGHTHIILICVTSRSPALASLIANTLIDTYIEHTFRDNYLATVKSSEWLDTQLGGLKENLQKSQDRMLELERDVGVFSADQTQSVTVANLEELNRRFAEAQVDRLVKEARYRAIRSAPSLVVDALAGSDPATQGPKMTLAQLRAEYDAATQTYGPAYPRVKELKAQIDQLQATLLDEEQAQIARTAKEFEAAKSNEEMLRGTLEAQEQGAHNNGAKAIQYELARKEYETNRLLYDGLQERLQEAGVMAGLHTTAVHIVDNADTPDFPSQPRKLLNLCAGLGVGLLIGLAAAFFKEIFDTNLKTMADIEQGLELPLLAVIPSIRPALLEPSAFRGMAMTQSAAACPKIAEALRCMRTAILLSNPGSPPKVIMITSSNPSEGKTSVSCSMAIMLALNGSRTLLMDADLRRPSVHHRFKLSQQRGLSSVLSGAHRHADVVAAWPELPTLHLLTSGPVPALPAELLGSKRMECLLMELRAEYDFIVIDTSPVLAVTDACLLGPLTDATILIVRYGEVQRPVVLRCLDLLERAGAKLAGVSVNAADLAAPGYAEYFGRKYDEYLAERAPA